MKLAACMIVFLVLGTVNASSPKAFQILRRWGAQVKPTRGEVWPKPRLIDYNLNGYMALQTKAFKFNVTHHNCEILSGALTRYSRYLQLEQNAGHLAQYTQKEQANKNIPSGTEHASPSRTSTDFRGDLDALQVELTAPCENVPHSNMDESYELHIDSEDVPKGGKLVGQSIWGILRGLETFVQLVSPSLDGTVLHLSSCKISDHPRFPFRGLLIDTARHFLPVRTILQLVDGMEANKLNVLHWHIVDDQSFPYQSTTFPGLSKKGAYHPLTHVYSQSDVKAVVEYCRLRGIRVIPEFDTPAHSKSWGQAHPELLTACHNNFGPDGSMGPMDPTKESTYSFVAKLFREVAQVFPDKSLHIGGDEVDFTCWRSSPEVNAYMKDHGIGNGDYRKLEGLFIDRLLKDVNSINMSAIVWQEVFDNHAGTLKNDTIVHVWKYSNTMDSIRRVTAAGHKALLSSCWYLDNLPRSWFDFYDCDPHNFAGTAEQRRLVVGGVACMWGEGADQSNVVARVFPRASAAAERLWSDASVTDIDEAARRIEEFRCKLRIRGINAQPPNGPAFCPGETFNVKDEV